MSSYFRIEIYNDIPLINASYSNESQMGSENFHCLFCFKTLRKAKINVFYSSKNDYCLHLFNKHLEFEKKVVEEKLEPNGQSTVCLALFLEKRKK